jgi:hypothetical protein
LQDLDNIRFEPEGKPPIIITHGEKLAAQGRKGSLDSPKIIYLKPDERPSSGKIKTDFDKKLMDSNGNKFFIYCC